MIKNLTFDDLRILETALSDYWLKNWRIYGECDEWGKENIYKPHLEAIMRQREAVSAELAARRAQK